MISSQSHWKFPDPSNGIELTKIKKELKKEIEDTTLFGKPLFSVWINDVTSSQPLSETDWEVCMNNAKNCDILICLYNGHSGSQKNKAGIGFCEAELNAGYSQAPGKVRIIEVGNSDDVRANNTGSKKELDDKFYEWIQNIGPYWDSVHSIEELKDSVKKALFEVIMQLSEGGLREVNRGNAYLGPPLEWRRLNYLDRQKAMIEALTQSIKSVPGRMIENDHSFLPISGKEILFIPSAIPDSMSISQAKEMVGQPFLKDYEKASWVGDNQGGPMHVIACYSGATETQAKKLLGFPDATVIPAPFGVYVADNVQKVQFVFIAKCTSEASTKNNFQMFVNWLHQGGEDKFLAKRALSRAKIIRVIEEEYDE